MTFSTYMVPHQRSSPVDNLPYIMFEFCLQIDEKSKVNNETSGKPQKPGVLPSCNPVNATFQSKKLLIDCPPDN